MEISSVNIVSDVFINSDKTTSTSKNQQQAEQIQAKSDSYKGTIPQDVTYLNQINHSTKQSKSRLAINSDSKTISRESITTRNSKNNTQHNFAKPASIKTSKQLEANSKIGLQSRDLSEQIVKDIIIQNQKNIEKFNEYNLSKRNRLTKTIPSTV